MKPVAFALWAVCVAVWVSIEAVTAAGSCESLSGSIDEAANFACAAP